MGHTMGSLLTGLFGLFSILFVLGLFLYPPLKKRSLKEGFLSVFLTSTGILIPCLVFLLSVFLTPEWKGGCRHGWWDCFFFGKLALTPLVVWACASFYVAQVLRPSSGNRTWVVLGLFAGSVTSTICLLIGLILIGIRSGVAWWLLVPLYVCAWYSILFIRSKRSSHVKFKHYAATVFSMVPYWIGTAFWSKTNYLSLQETMPDCFVVTAALHGHEGLVGPLTVIERYGVPRVANKQLRVFWQFEELWMTHSPLTHQVFRRFYNRLGPLIASRVESNVQADAVYLLLKPLETIAAKVVCMGEKKRTNAKNSCL
jgi:hypothetical protein